MKYLITTAIVLSVLFFVSCSTKPGITIYLSKSKLCYYSSLSVETKRKLGCYKKRTMVASNWDYYRSVSPEGLKAKCSQFRYYGCVE